MAYEIKLIIKKGIELATQMNQNFHVALEAMGRIMQNSAKTKLCSWYLLYKRHRICP